MKEGKIKLNENEAKALIELLNVAVKSLGLQGAEVALVLVRKVEEAFKHEEQPDSPPITNEPSCPTVVDIQDLEK